MKLVLDHLEKSKLPMKAINLDGNTFWELFSPGTMWDVNNGWQGDKWTSQYGEHELEKISTSIVTSTSNDMATGRQIYSAWFYES